MTRSQKRRDGRLGAAIFGWLSHLRSDGGKWSLEPLESRNVPAITANFDAGILTVSGDGADDTIVIIENGGVEVIGTTIAGGPIAASAVLEIDVDGGAGGDFIDLRGVSASTGFINLSSVSVTGGLGDDIIFGADDVGSDLQFLEGAQGNDTIQGGNVGDFIAGGYLFNSFGLTDPTGNDFLDGAAGDDQIFGDDSSPIAGANDTLFGGPGNDTLLGQLGDDLYVFGDDWGLDRLSDPGGIDTIDFGPANVPINIGSNVGSVPAGVTNGLSFETDEIERYFGGSGDDTFTFGPGANFGNGAALLNGREGLNTLDYSLFGSTATVDFIAGVAQATGIARALNIQQAINATVTGTPPSIVEASATALNPTNEWTAPRATTDEAAESTAETTLASVQARTHDGHTTPGGGSVADIDAGPEGPVEQPGPEEAAEADPAATMDP